MSLGCSRLTPAIHTFGHCIIGLTTLRPAVLSSYVYSYQVKSSFTTKIHRSASLCTYLLYAEGEGYTPSVTSNSHTTFIVIRRPVVGVATSPVQTDLQSLWFIMTKLTLYPNSIPKCMHGLSELTFDSAATISE